MALRGIAHACRSGRHRSWGWASILGVLFLGACGSSADVSRDELVPIIERDSLTFPDVQVPAEMVERLAGYRVVILGETHHLREHWALVPELVGALRDEGFGQLLIEAPNMAAWLFDDYVIGGLLLPDYVPPTFWRVRLEPVRELNQTLPPEERIHVFGIDVNENYYGGAEGFRDHLELARSFLGDASLIDDFLLADYDSRQAQTEAVDRLLAGLEVERVSLADAWGPVWYATVVEMVGVERSSIDIRAYRESDDNRAARAREDVIKQLADAHIGMVEGRTLINIGGHHAQKAHLMGTDQEWLGDYLAHSSPIAGGSVFSIGIRAAEIVLEPGASGTPFNVRDASPDNELLRVIVETLPDRTVFLPLDDPLFAERTVALNSEETIYVTILKNQYDAVLQYGLAHRMPID